MTAQGGCLPSVEPPNPVATTMGPPAAASKGRSTFDTALHPRQWGFMEGASWLTPGCGGTSLQLGPSGNPPADPPPRPGHHRGRGPGGLGGAEPGGDGGRGCHRCTGGHLLPEAQLPRARPPCRQRGLRGGREWPAPGCRQPPLPALPAGSPAARLSADAVQPGGQHQHGWWAPCRGRSATGSWATSMPLSWCRDSWRNHPHEGGAAAPAAGR
jgi:hypothetical protein